LNFNLLDHPKLFRHDVTSDNSTNHPDVPKPRAEVSKLLLQKATNNMTGNNNIISNFTDQLIAEKLADKVSREKYEANKKRDAEKKKVTSTKFSVILLM
jgi:hypothetical protein